jgi:hypothetical protein
MRPDQVAPLKLERPAPAEPAYARSERERLSTTYRSQGPVLEALGEAVSALCVRSSVLRAESAELCVHASALRAENAELRAARRRRAASTRAGVGVRARVSRALPLDVHAPATARTVVTEFLNGRVPASVLESARLMVSELVTDSLHHSGVSDTVVIVGVQLTPAMVRLEVSDPGRAGVIRPRSPFAADGRGFRVQLLESLSERWGLERAAAGRTRTWAQLLRTPPASNGGPPPEPDAGTP